MPEEKKQIKKPHSIILENRRTLSISGIEDVDSFDEQMIILFTGYGVLTVKGENLHLGKLNVDSGEVSVEGNISSLTYSDDDNRKGGLFSRLFK